MHRSIQTLLVATLFATLSGAALSTAHAQNASASVEVRGPNNDYYYRRSRLRLGVQGDIGGIQNADAGFGVGLTGQLGIQHSDLFATYYQPRFFAGGYVAGDREGGIVAIYNTFMFNLTLADVFEIGLGPSLDLGVANVCPLDTRGSNGSCDGFGGAFFGTDFRLALVIGGGARRRGGFDIALHSHPTWISPNEAITSVTLGFGFQLY